MSLLRTTLACCFALACAAAPAPDHAPTAKHVKAGVGCGDCHGAGAPTKAPKMAACVTCHGDFPVVAALTKALPANPHDSHMDDPDCTECHRQHRPPVVKCQTCHADFKFNAK
jgi:fumarate reductase flavoprotein subunit